MRGVVRPMARFRIRDWPKDCKMASPLAPIRFLCRAAYTANAPPSPNMAPASARSVLYKHCPSSQHGHKCVPTHHSGVLQDPVQAPRMKRWPSAAEPQTTLLERATRGVQVKSSSVKGCRGYACSACKGPGLFDGVFVHQPEAPTEGLGLKA